jgi:tetratricopeptide (TPR) repeat protein
MNFIRLLAQFEVISKDFIFSIVPENNAYPMLERLASEHIIEMLGFDGDVVRLNDAIRDYIKRNRLKLTDEYNSKIKKQVKDLVSSDDIFEKDSSEFIFGLKESLKNDSNIDHNRLIPSHYLRCMKDLYHSKGNLDQVISLADIILQKKNNLEKSIIQDIRYYLCLALAKKQDQRMLKEVQNINGNEHLFLLGYYYRLAGRYKDALENLNQIIDEPYVDSRAKRELVQVYVYLEEFDKALDFAKRNYEENRGNQFHTQAYFNCLINSASLHKYKDKLKYLITDLRNINSDQSNEMADISEALFYAKLEDNKQVAFDKIEDCIYRYPDSHYPLLTFCDIAVKYTIGN